MCALFGVSSLWLQRLPGLHFHSSLPSWSLLDVCLHQINLLSPLPPPEKKHNTYIFMSNSVLFLPGNTASVSLQNPWRWSLLAGCWEERCAAFLDQVHENFSYAVFVIYFLYPRSPWTGPGGLREQRGYPCTHVSIRPLRK